jgi:hypothetical protein
MASLSYTPTEATLTPYNAQAGNANPGQSFQTKLAAKGILAAAAVAISLMGCRGIPLITVAAGVSVYISTDPALAMTSTARNWTLVADGDGFVDCPAAIAFEGTGAWEIMAAG